MAEGLFVGLLLGIDVLGDMLGIAVGFILGVDMLGCRVGELVGEMVEWESHAPGIVSYIISCSS